ncbi:MAG: hypothetical protein EON51_16970 [Acinetobacter sp.]|nr:MAG: hypothetical protein EON51_16970 [Acinetobacter sp.]
MKRFIAMICSLIVLTFSSCKKELDISVKKTYVEKGGKASDLGFGGVMLTLMPDGKAGLLLAGDVFVRYTYTIKDDTITLKEGDNTVKFKIISETQLLYEKDRILILANN